ncbi:hypothetical protein AB0M43_34825 [Longispora sp. NPDC051575]|uniref:hypothetical protein n=1 Tax=Longispora sp. NPDC051575 TaxID=3154943 RepID=UPI00344AA18C
MPELRRLRAACDRKLASIDVPAPFDRDTFVATIAGLRGRPILLRPLAVPAGPDTPFGVWVAAPDADFIYIDPTTSDWHQDHVVCHEIGHMLWGHTASDTELDQTVIPDLDPAMVLSMLGRHDYSSMQEQEAEVMATAILAKAGRRLVKDCPDRGANRVAAALSLDHA